MIGADLFDDGLGVPRQRSTHPADVVIGLPGQEAGFAISFLPQAGGGKSQQRQRASLALHLGQHLLHQLVVLETITTGGGRLDQRPAEVGTGRRLEKGQLVKDRPQRRVGVAGSSEIIPHRNHHVHVCFQRRPPQQRRELPLVVGGVLREQLLELINEKNRSAARAAPARDRLDDHIGIVGFGHHRLKRQRVSCQLGSQRAAERGKC